MNCGTTPHKLTPLTIRHMILNIPHPIARCQVGGEEPGRWRSSASALLIVAPLALPPVSCTGSVEKGGQEQVNKGREKAREPCLHSTSSNFFFYLKPHDKVVGICLASGLGDLGR